ncbi:cytochrome C oxidase copper chaperone family protein [Peziza echinospora]|nr:cytochrome C oxidase copper chaperone family protein [Peziza echinospora]
MSAAAAEACPLPSAATKSAITPSSSSSTASTPTPAAAPKPCCVCKPEKAARDECLLFSDRGEEDCRPTIQAYKACMAGYGFKLP